MSICYFICLLDILRSLGEQVEMCLFLLYVTWWAGPISFEKCVTDSRS